LLLFFSSPVAATFEFSTPSLHDALPIFALPGALTGEGGLEVFPIPLVGPRFGGRVVRRERRLGMLGRTERRRGFRFRVLPGERGLHHRVGRRRLAGGGRGWGVVFPHPELPPFRGGGPGGVRLPPFRGRPPLGWCGPARCRIKTVSHDDTLPWKSPHHSGLLRACAALARGGAARYPTRCNQRTGTPAPA